MDDQTTINLLAATDGLTIRYGSDASNYFEWTKDRADFAVGWNKLNFIAATADSQTGTPDQTAMAYLFVNLTTVNSGDTWAAGKVVMDDIRVQGRNFFHESFNKNSYDWKHYVTIDRTSLQFQSYTMNVPSKRRWMFRHWMYPDYAGRADSAFSYQFNGDTGNNYLVNYWSNTTNTATTTNNFFAGYHYAYNSGTRYGTYGEFQILNNKGETNSESMPIIGHGMGFPDSLIYMTLGGYWSSAATDITSITFLNLTASRPTLGRIEVFYRDD
jgi:hypothetical protein